MRIILMGLSACVLVACLQSTPPGPTNDISVAPPTDSNTSVSPPEDAGVTPADTLAQPDTAEPVDLSYGPALKNELVTLSVGGVEREYRLYVPTLEPTAPLPLILAFHGGGGANWPYPQQNKFHQLAEEEGVIIAHPLAQLQPGNEGEWQLNTAPDSRHDLDFVEGVIDDIASRYPVDAKRVYATGYSLGSMFVYELACHLSTRFAALASHAGTMPVNPNSCTPEDDVAIMHLHGREDEIIAYSNSWDWKAWDEVGTMMDIPALILYWKEKFSCSNLVLDESTPSLHVTYDDCDGDIRVEHHRLQGANHDWPETIQGVSTHETIWTFFSDFKKP